MEAVLEGLDRVRRRWEVQDEKAGEEEMERMDKMVDRTGDDEQQSGASGESTGGSNVESSDNGVQDDIQTQLLRTAAYRYTRYLQSGKLCEEEKEEKSDSSRRLLRTAHGEHKIYLCRRGCACG